MARLSMKEYQAVIIRLQGKAREDEDAITDLLNERARTGWSSHAVQPLDGGRLLVVFMRET
jgi:hypothetical protein